MAFLPQQIFGIYAPQVGPGGVALHGMAGVDWPYVLNVLFVFLFLWFFFRLIAGMFRR